MSVVVVFALTVGLVYGHVRRVGIGVEVATSGREKDLADEDFEDGRRRFAGLYPTTRPPTQHDPSRTTQQRVSLSPTVPGHVQSDLLQVGMRVRKSVPEGYKTHNKMSTLPTIQTTLALPTTTITAVSLDVKTSNGPVPEDYVHQRELLPFCGLHKIGGYAEQPTTDRSTNIFPLPAQAFSQPFSSQGSTDSGYGSESLRPNLLNPSKRSWHDEDDVRLDISGSNFFFSIPMKGSVEEVPVSPLSELPSQNIAMLPIVRQYAQPKSRRQAARTGFSGDEDVDMDVENAAQIEGRVVVGSVSDFEEADFLGVGEVSMGGV
ncbi:ribonucleotide reductase inhibitor-domain-containing protein [Phaeosphaeriaceae sp. PMI808]|nr:ribonucleotide reductase inhibitor-domain-containing protein [Phaeosphaeriaceae sp. PMI808]